MIINPTMLIHCCPFGTCYTATWQVQHLYAFTAATVDISGCGMHIHSSEQLLVLLVIPPWKRKALRLAALSRRLQLCS